MDIYDSPTSSPINFHKTVLDGNGQELFGLDAELELKRQEKYDSSLEKIALEWIGSVLDEKIYSISELRSGIFLCRLIQKLKPGLIQKYHTQSGSIYERENIKLYLEACRQLKMNSMDLFSVNDLYEKKNLSQVLQNLLSLGRLSANIHDYEGPSLSFRKLSKTPVKLVKHWDVPLSPSPVSNYQILPMEVHVLKEQNKELLVKLDKLQELLSQTQKKCDSLQSERAKLQSKFQTLAGRNLELAPSSEDTRNYGKSKRKRSLLEMNGDSEDNFEPVSKRRISASYIQEIEHLRRFNDSLREVVDELQKSNLWCENQITFLKETIAQKDQEIKDYIAQIVILNDRLATLTQVSMNMTSLPSSQEYQSLLQEKDEINTALQILDQERKSLSETNEQVLLQVAAFQETIQQRNDQLFHQHQELEERKQQLTDLEEQLNTQQELQLQTQSAYQQETSLLRKKLQDLNNEKIELEKELEWFKLITSSPNSSPNFPSNSPSTLRRRYSFHKENKENQVGNRTISAEEIELATSAFHKNSSLSPVSKNLPSTNAIKRSATDIRPTLKSSKSKNQLQLPKKKNTKTVLNTLAIKRQENLEAIKRNLVSSRPVSIVTKDKKKASIKK